MKLKINSIILTLILLTNFECQAQVNLDSLWNLWNDETAPETTRALALLDLSWSGYMYSQPDSALFFAQMMYDFASKKGLNKEMAMARSTQGVASHMKSDYLQALDYHQKSLVLYEDISDKIGIAGCLNNIGIIYREKGYYLKALNYYERILKIMEELQENNAMPNVYLNIGVIYHNKGDYSKAMEYYQKYYKIMEELSDLRGKANALHDIGLIYSDLGDYDKALEYYQQGLKIKKEISDKSGIADCLNNIGLIYINQADYPRALNYFQQSLKIKEEIFDKRGMINTFTNIGIVYWLQKNFEMAIYWCEKGLQKSEEINILEEQKQACGCLYDVYKSIGNNSKALSYHERKIALEDSLHAKETSKKLQQMEFHRQIREDSLVREREKLIVKIAHEKEVGKKKRTKNILLATALFFLIIAIGLYRRMLFVRKTKRAIEYEKNRSDNLLLNILPGEIAEELKEKGIAKARNYDIASILFTDFKGFTQISEKISAEELVHEINTCFKAFDAICQKYAIEKIKTIGDAYMAAGGLPVPQDDSVKNTVQAAIEMAEFMINRKSELEKEGSICFEMRLGIHTGSVVAGIVGETKFQYDIWGDAVNIASCMENLGKTGKVNISRATYELLKDDPSFTFESRGAIEVKGKGKMDMWFVSVKKKTN